MTPEKRIVVGITGASGGPYALRLLQCLSQQGAHVHLVVSANGRWLLSDECGVTQLDAASLIGDRYDRLTVHNPKDMAASIASGSFRTDGMVICPCSSHTMGAVASGLGDTLLTRAACVTLKERRPLVMLHREMPVNAIDLENMLRLHRAGAVICPAAPGFYLHPKSVDDLVDFVVGRLLDLLGVPHRLNVRWPRADAGDRAPSSQDLSTS